jgi:hypothetical protein
MPTYLWSGWDPFTILLYHSLKSPEKKWHRSVKMDKNINVHFSKVPGKSCKRPLGKTHCEHNAANSDFSVKMLTAYFFKYFMGKRV